MLQIRFCPELYLWYRWGGSRHFSSRHA